MSDTKPEIQEAQRTQIRINTKKKKTYTQAHHIQNVGNQR